MALAGLRWNQKYLWIHVELGNVKGILVSMLNLMCWWGSKIRCPWVVGDNSFRHQKRNGSWATGNKLWEWIRVNLKGENGKCIHTHIHTDKKYKEIKKERQSVVKNLPADTGDNGHDWSLGHEDPLGKEVLIYSSILAWEIPWTEEPGGLQSMGSQESDTT